MIKSLSIVVPTHASIERPIRVLEGICRQAREGLELEVLIAGNLADMGLANAIAGRDWPFQVRYLHSGRMGVNIARNLGLRKAQHSIALFLDDDCLPSAPDFLQKLVHAHDRYPEYVAIGGGYLSAPKCSDAGRMYNWISNDWLGARFDAPFETSRLIGGCVSYRSDRLRDEQLFFDEEIPYGGAETEFHERLQRHGHRLLFHHELWVEHDCRISYEDLERKSFMQGYGKARRRAIHSELERVPAPETTPWRRCFRDLPEYVAYQRAFQDGVQEFHLERMRVGWLWREGSRHSRVSLAAAFARRRSARIGRQIRVQLRTQVYWRLYHWVCELTGRTAWILSRIGLDWRLARFARLSARTTRVASQRKRALANRLRWTLYHWRCELRGASLKWATRFGRVMRRSTYSILRLRYLPSRVYGWGIVGFWKLVALVPRPLKLWLKGRVATEVEETTR